MQKINRLLDRTPYYGLAFFLLIPFLLPYVIVEWLQLDTLQDIWKVLSGILLIFLMLKDKQKPSKIIWIIASGQVWLIITTLLNQKTIMSATMGAFTIVVFSQSVVYLFKKGRQRLLNFFMVFFEIATYGTLANLLFFPVFFGVNNYLLGSYVSYISWFTIALSIALTCFYVKGNKIRPLLLIVTILWCTYRMWSATTVVAVTLLTIIGFVPFLRKHCSIRLGLIALFAFCLFIVIFRMQDYFAFIIENILHRSLTFSGRTEIWDEAIAKIKASPFIGYGYYYNLTWGNVAHPHNQVLHHLMQGGIPYLLQFMIFNFFVSKSAQKRKENLLVQLAQCTIFIILVTCMVDIQFNRVLAYIPYIVISCCADS